MLVAEFLEAPGEREAIQILNVEHLLYLIELIQINLNKYRYFRINSALLNFLVNINVSAPYLTALLVSSNWQVQLCKLFDRVDASK